MKTIVCATYGGPEVLEFKETSKPVPQPYEILIKINSFAVTTAGSIGRKGKPYISRIFSGLSRPKAGNLGMEFSGTVEELGRNIRGYVVGQSVYGLTGITTGTHSEYICLPKDAVFLSKPVNVNHQEAVSLIEGGLTAINFLKHKTQLQRGDRILIYGASGSVGTAVIQIAKYFEANVTAVCSTRNINLMRSLRVDHVIDYREEDFTKGTVQYDVIFDTLGKYSFPKCKDVLTSEGIYLSANGFSTVLYELRTSLGGKKKAKFSSTYLRSNESLIKDLSLLSKLIELEYLQPIIDKVYAFGKTIEAHKYVETGKKVGSVIVSLV